MSCPEQAELLDDRGYEGIITDLMIEYLRGEDYIEDTGNSLAARVTEEIECF